MGIGWARTLAPRVEPGDALPVLGWVLWLALWGWVVCLSWAKDSECNARIAVKWDCHSMNLQISIDR
jgi:hypothetical protein